MLIQYSRLKKIIVLMVVITICAVPFFYEIGKLGIQEWDESLFAQNAIEMARNNNFITKFSQGKPDLFNTKPPLITWVQAIFMKVFGENVYALRVPIGLSAVAIMSIVFWFVGFKLKNIYVPIIYCLLLCTSFAIVKVHVGRTGDHDLPLSLFLLISILQFYLYLDTNNLKHLYLTNLFLVLSVLIKSVFVFLIFPGLFICLLVFNNGFDIFKNKHLYINIFLFLGCSSLYFIIREYDSPGYFKAVYELDIMRYSSTVDLHKHEFSYYFKDLFLSDEGLGFWKYLIPLSTLCIYYYPKKYKRFAYFITINAVVFLLIISISQTKLIWYQTLFVVLILINIAFFIYWIINVTIKSFDIKNNYAYYLLYTLIICSIFYAPYVKIINNIKNIKESEQGLNFGQFINKLSNENKLPHSLNVLAYPWNRQVLYYQTQLNRSFLQPENNLNFKIGDTVMVCENNFYTGLMSRYSYEVIEKFESCALIKIYAILNLNNSNSDKSNNVYNYTNLKFSNPIVEYDGYANSKIISRITPLNSDKTFCYGPYTSLSKGNYLAIFRLKTNNHFVNSPIANLKVSVNNPQLNLASLTINSTDFVNSNVYTDFTLPFKLESNLENVEFVIDYLGIADLSLDEIKIVNHKPISDPNLFNYNSGLRTADNAIFSYDTTSYSGVVISTKKPTQEIISYGPYVPIKSGYHAIIIKLKRNNMINSTTASSKIKVDIYSNTKKQIFKEEVIELSNNNNYTEFKIEFKLETALDDIEFRVFNMGSTNIKLDYIKLIK